MGEIKRKNKTHRFSRRVITTQVVSYTKELSTPKIGHSAEFHSIERQNCKSYYNHRKINRRKSWCTQQRQCTQFPFNRSSMHLSIHPFIHSFIYSAIHPSNGLVSFNFWFLALSHSVHALTTTWMCNMCHMVGFCGCICMWVCVRLFTLFIRIKCC